MLRARLRLKKNYQFKYTYKKGLGVHSKYLILIFAPGTRKAVKIGFSVSNKLGKAVVRNRLKRQLRAVCAQNLCDFIQGYNYIFVAKSGAQQCSYENLNQILSALLQRMHQKLQRVN